MKKRSSLYDILTGLVSATLVFTLFSYLQFDLAFVLSSPVALLAGLLRGKDPAEHTLPKVILLNIPFFLLLVAVLNGVFHLLLIFILVLVGAAAGIAIRRAFPHSKIRVAFMSGAYFVAVSCIGLLVLPAYFGATLWNEEEIAAPDFTFLSTEKDTLRMQDYSGKVLVISFWATWCGPCKEQMPELNRIYQRYRNNEKVAFLFVNPCGQDSYDKALAYVRKSGFDLPFVMDIKNISTKKFPVSGLPALLMVDHEGVIRYSHRGHEKSEDLSGNFSKRLDRLLEGSTQF